MFGVGCRLPIPRPVADNAMLSAQPLDAVQTRLDTQRSQLLGNLSRPIVAAPLVVCGANGRQQLCLGSTARRRRAAPLYTQAW